MGSRQSSGSKLADFLPRCNADRTVLFTDIVRSTELATEHGDQAWSRLFDRHDECVAKEVTGFGGRVVNTTGNGLLALLDSPSQAVACAVALTRGLGAPRSADQGGRAHR